MQHDNTTPIIGYDNLLTQGTSTGDGTNPANAYDWYTHTAWTTGAASGYLEADIGSSVTANYYAVAGHNINTRSGACKLQYWTGAAYADCVGSSYTPASDDVFVVTFPQCAATKYKFVVSGLSAAATLSVVSFGEYTQFPVGVTAGYAPPRFVRRTTLYNAATQDGAYLGRSVIRTGTAGRLAFAHMTEAWARDELEDFLEACETQGWFLLWSPAHYPREAAYCWTTRNPDAKYEDVGYMATTIEYEGVTA